MNLTPSEQRLVELINAMPGGSYCPGRDKQPGHDVSRLIRRLERNGVLDVETTDDGVRYTVREGADG